MCADQTEPAAEDVSSRPSEKKTKEKSKRFFKRLAKIVAGFVVVSLTATEAMMFIMFGRTDPVLDAPFDILNWAKEMKYKASAVSFMSGANKLRGYTIIPRSPAALVLIVHGVRSSSDALEPVVKYFIQHSYAVMTFDGTASGRSEGDKTVGLQQQRYDIRAALDYIQSDPDISGLPLIMLGHSAGAYGVAVETPKSGAVASICVSGFESPLKTMRFWAEHYAGALTNIEYPFLWIREYAAKGNEASESGAETLGRCDCPVLVVHGNNDEVIPLQISLYQAVAAAKPKKAETILVTDDRFNGHSNILVSGNHLNHDLLHQILGFISYRLPGR